MPRTHSFSELESLAGFRHTPRVLLDRMLDNAGTEITPFIVCDVRRGVRIAVPKTDAALVHCVVRGNGMLWTALDDDALPLAAASVAIVPAHTACFIEPLGGSSRVISLDAAGTSDHVARLSAGAGEPGLVLVSARLRGREPAGLCSFDVLPAPVAVDLSDVEGALSLLERIEREQQERRAANRRMIELSIEQCLIHALRKLDGSDCAPPWLRGLRDEGLARALNAILRTPSAPHSLRALAETAGLAQATFGARFEQAFGSAPLDLLDRVRMRRALALLRTTELSPTSIAQHVGLPAQGALARELTRLAAQAPRWLGPTRRARSPKARAAKGSVPRKRAAAKSAPFAETAVGRRPTRAKHAR